MHPNEHGNGHPLSTKLADVCFGEYIQQLANIENCGVEQKM